MPTFQHIAADGSSTSAPFVQPTTVSINTPRWELIGGGWTWIGNGKCPSFQGCPPGTLKLEHNKSIFDNTEKTFFDIIRADLIKEQDLEFAQKQNLQTILAAAVSLKIKDTGEMNTSQGLVNKENAKKPVNTGQRAIFQTQVDNFAASIAICTKKIKECGILIANNGYDADAVKKLDSAKTLHEELKWNLAGAKADPIKFKSMVDPYVLHILSFELNYCKYLIGFRSGWLDPGGNDWDTLG